MSKPNVSRDAFRGLFALYAAKAHHDHNNDGEDCLLKLYGSSEHISEDMLALWSDRAELLGVETVGSLLTTLAREDIAGTARYDHANDFLHRLLQEMGRREH